MLTLHESQRGSSFGRAWQIALFLLALPLLTTASACMYRGTAKDTQVTGHAQKPGWTVLTGVPNVRQRSLQGCGASAVAAVRQYWGEKVDEATVRKSAGVKLDRPLKAGALRDSMHVAGYEAYLVKGDLAQLAHELAQGRPVIVGTVKPYGRNSVITHYQVVVGIHPERGVLTMDPAEGYREYPRAGFLAEWEAAQRVALVSAPARPLLTSNQPAH